MGNQINNIYTDALRSFGCDSEFYINIRRAYQESHRTYHNFSHIFKITICIKDDLEHGIISPVEAEAQLVTALFHDLIYQPRLPKGMNEQLSAEAFKANCKNIDHIHYNNVYETILTSADHVSNNSFSNRFFDYDLNIFKSSIEDLIEFERSIFKEYSWVSFEIYRARRIEVLKHYKDRFDDDIKRNIDFLISYVSTWKPKIGIYAGSFSPFHIGHLEILNSSKQLFDQVIIARGVNPDKEVLNLQNEKSRLAKILPMSQIDVYEGLLTDYLEQKLYSGLDVTLIRGIRDEKDIAYERMQLAYMEDIIPSGRVNCLFLLCDRELTHVSSSGIKSLAKINKEASELYLVKEPFPQYSDIFII